MRTELDKDHKECLQKNATGGEIKLSDSVYKNNLFIVINWVS